MPVTVFHHGIFVVGMPLVESNVTIGKVGQIKKLCHAGLCPWKEGVLKSRFMQ